MVSKRADARRLQAEIVGTGTARVVEIVRPAGADHFAAGNSPANTDLQLDSRRSAQAIPVRLWWILGTLWLQIVGHENRTVA